MSLSTHPTWQTIEARLAPLGLTIRPFRDPADYAPMAALMGLANMHDGIPWVPSEEQMRTENEGADGLVPKDDIVLVEHGHELVALAMVERVVRDDVTNYDLWGYVRPDFRRRGIGSTLFERNVGRIAVRIRIEDPDARVLVRAHAEESEIGHRTLLERRGFGPIRHFFLMHRATLDDVPDVVLPDGLELRTVRPDDHRRSGMPRTRRFATTGARMPYRSRLPGHLRSVGSGHGPVGVAWDGAEVAGVVQAWIWTKENERLGVKRGWLEKISVRRPWRKRGLGRAMTAVALGKLREAGCRRDAGGGLGEPDRGPRPVRAARIREISADDRVPARVRSVVDEPGATRLGRISADPASARPLRTDPECAREDVDRLVVGEVALVARGPWSRCSAALTRSPRDRATG